MNNTYNTTAYATWTPTLAASWDKFVIDWYWIHNANLYVINKTDRFKTDLKSYDFPIDNWKWFISNYYRGRTIKLDMMLKAETVWEFNEQLDIVRWQIARNDVYLKEKINWEYRQIKVTTTDLPLNPKYYNVTFLPFTVTFAALEPFWYSEKYTSHAYLNVTTDRQEEITNEGNVEIDPIITFSYLAASWVSFIRIDINWIYIQVNEAITDSDTVIINCIEKTVELNWTLVDYDWTFPQIETWSNIVNFTSDWTYDVDINALYRKNFK